MEPRHGSAPLVSEAVQATGAPALVLEATRSLPALVDVQRCALLHFEHVPLGLGPWSTRRPPAAAVPA